MMMAIAAPQKEKRLSPGWLLLGWLLFIWIMAGWFAAASAHADIYSWEDSQGVIHYSNQEVPPEAALYMREIPSPANAEPAETNHENKNDNVTQETARQQAQAREHLEEVNRKLSRALDKVDDLEASVARSKAQAEAASEAARQAEREAAAASSERIDVQERVIVHAVPYRRYGHHRYRYKYNGNNHRRHDITRRHSRNRNHEQGFKPNAYRSHSKIGRIKGRGKNAYKYKYQIPGPILPPEPHRIPAAYGVR